MQNKEDIAYSTKRFLHRIADSFFRIGASQVEVGQVAKGRLNWKQLLLGVVFDIGAKVTSELDPAKAARNNMEKNIQEVLGLLEQAKQNAIRLKSKSALAYIEQCFSDVHAIYGQLGNLETISDKKRQLSMIKEHAKIIAEATTFEDAEVNSGQGNKDASNQRPGKNYYDILGVSKSATADEIKAAFRNLAMKYHPDRYSGLADDLRQIAETRFKEINEAYQTLSDPQKKANYDSLLNGGD